MISVHRVNASTITCRLVWRTKAGKKRTVIAEGETDQLRHPGVRRVAHAEIGMGDPQDDACD